MVERSKTRCSSREIPVENEALVFELSRSCPEGSKIWRCKISGDAMASSSAGSLVILFLLVHECLCTCICYVV